MIDLGVIGVCIYAGMFVWIGYMDRSDVDLFEDVSKKGD
jgi:hypothetical protein